MPPEYDVVITVYNGAGMLGEALLSIAEQSHAPRNIIIVDDGSTDDFMADVQRSKVPVHVVAQAHSGQAAALNRGLALVGSPLVGFLDHDDLWTPDHSELLMHSMAADVDVVSGGVVNRFMRDTGSHEDVYMGPSRLLSSSLFRTLGVQRVGPFVEDLRSHTIIDWWSRAMALGLRIRAIDDSVLIRRIHGANEGMSAASRTRSDLLARVRAHRARSASS
jgi:glycosyltransferase involved in cell wall biosynthesis